MNQLETLQEAFQSALLHDQAMAPQLLSARGVAQFGIYQTAYRARLRAALRDNFEKLPLVMGDDAFDALANAYIDAHPSQHYSIRWFGHQLAAFMTVHEELVDHPAIVDLAHMEWALRNAFDAAPAELLTQPQLAAIPAGDWATLVFALHPSAQLLDLQWAIGPIWHALDTGQEDVAPPEALQHVLLVWRRGMNTQWKSLTPTEAVFMQCLRNGENFGSVCEALAHSVGEENAAPTAVDLLRHMLADGLIRAL